MSALAWRRLDAVGIERFRMEHYASGSTLRGTIVLVEDGIPFEARYEVRCDQAWVTRAVVVDLRGPHGDRSLRITAESGRWSADGAPLEVVRGCIDVDLGWTPSTNTLPVRRLALAVGESKSVTAAWIRFPELTVEPLSQEYRRLDERRYRYSSAGGRFVAELEVDEDGLVTTYGQIWARA